MKHFAIALLLVGCVVSTFAAETAADKEVQTKFDRLQARAAKFNASKMKRGIAPQWVTTVTTNDDATITKVMTKGTNTVTLVWHNTTVPVRYRARFHLLDEEGKANAVGAIQPQMRTEMQPATPIHTKAEVDRETDANLTEEIYMIYSR